MTFETASSKITDPVIGLGAYSAGVMTASVEHSAVPTSELYFLSHHVIGYREEKTN